jgi:hypothetical protein
MRAAFATPFSPFDLTVVKTFKKTRKSVAVLKLQTVVDFAKNMGWMLR